MTRGGDGRGVAAAIWTAPVISTASRLGPLPEVAALKTANLQSCTYECVCSITLVLCQKANGFFASGRGAPYLIG